MKAAQIKEYGSVENIEIVETAKPVASEGQVLVAVHAASLNPVDSAMLQGYTRQMADITLPATLGGDIAGTVEAVGSGVSNFKIGDKVYGQALALLGASGAFAEYSVTPASRIASAPANVDFNEAASLPLVGASALQAINEHMQLKSGQKLFIHGASGGIGTAAIQIAKHVGAYVAASARGDKSTALTGLGADEVIDTEKQDFAVTLKEYDAVLNLTRGEDFAKFFAILKSGGVIVSLTGQPDDTASNNKNVKVISQMTDTNTERLNELRELVEQGVVKPQVALTYSLEQTREAFQKLEAGGTTGKIVISISQ